MQLSRRDRLKGQRLFQRYITLNGISVAFMMNDLLILYGIRNGLTDPQIAVLASFMHLAMPFMIIGKQLIPRYGLSTSWAAAWFMRYVFGSIMILAPFVGRAAPQWAVVATILLGAFGFSVFRSIGLTANSALMGEITTSRDRGRFISGNWMRAQVANFFSMILVIAVMRFYSEVWVYQILIGAACLLGFYASVLLAKVPETETPRVSARKPIMESLRISFSRKRYRRTLIAWSAGFSAFVLVVPFSIVTIKNGYGLSDYTALMFALLLLVGGVTAARVNAGISDRVGPRPLLILYIIGFFVVAGYWIFAPDRFQPAAVGFIFFLAGFMKTGINVGISHYFLSAVDIQDRVGISMFARMFSGAAAGIVGSVGGGSIITLLQQSGLSGLPLYRSYFMVIFIILIPLCILMLRLERLKEWPVRSVLSLLFSMRDLKALYVMNRLEQSRGSDEDLAHVQQLRNIASNLSESTLRRMMESHRLSVRVHAMHALRELDFGEKTADALIHELRCGEFTSGWNAAEILGEHRIEAAVPELRRGLESEDPFLVGKCMVALVRLGDASSYQRIREIFGEADNPRITIHGANAFAGMKDPAMITDILEKISSSDLHPQVADELLSAVAALCGCEQMFYQFLREYILDRDQALAGLKIEIEQLTGRAYEDPKALEELPFVTILETGFKALEEEEWFRYLRDFIEDREFGSLKTELRLKFLACLTVIANACDGRGQDGGSELAGE